MSMIYYIEKWDAKYGIPRPLDSPHLTAYHALLRFARNAFEMFFIAAGGFLCALMLSTTAQDVKAAGQLQLIFFAAVLGVISFSLMEAFSLMMPYMRVSQRLTHGSAMWADTAWLKKDGFVPAISGDIKPGQLRLGTLTNGHDLILPASHTMRHLALLGPPGSGKSATFLMTFIRDWARSGSVIVLDPKGELYEQTAAEYRHAFRLDLLNTTISDGWNFLPACKGNAEFAHEVANIIIGLDNTKQSTDTDKFWQVSEVAALTAILLHLPEIATNPTPAMINEFISNRSLDPAPGKTESPMAEEVLNSRSLDARLYWGTFSKAKREVQGGILTGLSVKCAPFTTPNVKRVTNCDPDIEPDRIVDLRMLRDPGTAIYVVIPEGDASRYSTFLATFFGLAMETLRKTTVHDGSIPCLFVFDEAGNIPIHGLKEMLGVGRGRKVGLVLGYQNLAQVYSQYGKEGGDAILGSIGTMVFLPGLDDRTARYAAGRIGTTTVLRHTTVDAAGTKYDNERLAESGRDLLDHSELRQLVRHTQAVAIIDNVPPIKFRFPPFAPRRNVRNPVSRESSEIISLLKAQELLKQAELNTQIASRADAEYKSKTDVQPAASTDATLAKEPANQPEAEDTKKPESHPQEEQTTPRKDPERSVEP